MRIAITLGDPAGIGPEVTLKALRLLPKSLLSQILLLGRSSFYQALSEKLRIRLPFADPSHLPARAASFSGRVSCSFPGDFPKKVKYGQFDNRLTKLAVRSVEWAVHLAMRGFADAIVTPPVNKAGLKKAGFDIPGHTEFLAELSGTKHVEMMLVGEALRVVPVTRHVALRDVPRLISKKRVEEAILLTDRELRRSFRIKKPRLVVCGLNPHAGEEGRFGKEEITKIFPAVRSARKQTNAQIVGPLSPDALFHDAYTGRYDAEICMYHDQGLIPLKMISRGHGVNVTLGLPFVRTSPDHGTAYDIAGKFRADPGSMLAAIKLAFSLAKNRKRSAEPRR